MAKWREQHEAELRKTNTNELQKLIRGVGAIDMNNYWSLANSYEDIGSILRYGGNNDFDHSSLDDAFYKLKQQKYTVASRLYIMKNNKAGNERYSELKVDKLSGATEPDGLSPRNLMA
jgi:hypothetical protein